MKNRVHWMDGPGLIQPLRENRLICTSRADGVYNDPVANRKPSRRGTGQRNSRCEEGAMVLVLVMTMFLGEKLSLPALALGLFIAVGMIPLVRIAMRTVGLSDDEIPRVRLGQAAGLAAVLAVDAWSQRLRVVPALRFTFGFAPSILLVYFFFGPWHRFMPVDRNNDLDGRDRKDGLHE